MASLDFGDHWFGLFLADAILADVEIDDYPCSKFGTLRVTNPVKQKAMGRPRPGVTPLMGFRLTR